MGLSEHLALPFVKGAGYSGILLKDKGTRALWGYFVEAWGPVSCSTWSLTLSQPVRLNRTFGRYTTLLHRDRAVQSKAHM